MKTIMPGVKKVPYGPVRNTLVVSGIFCLTGSLPRLLGIVKTKAEWLTIMSVIDVITVAIFIGALLFSVWAILHNAKLSK